MVFRIFRRLIRALRIWYHGSTRDGSVSEHDAKTVNDLPASCLRGLRLARWVVDGRYVATEAFFPDSQTAGQREDGGLETSVNWEDDSTVESFTLADHGIAQQCAARIATADIEHTSRTVVAVNRPLSCERKPQTGNQYHGNIVYSARTPKILRKQLAATLASRSSLVSTGR